MRTARNVGIVLVIFAGAAVTNSGCAGLLDHATGRDAKLINGAVTALNTYPGHTRDGVTSTDLYGRTTTEAVQWNPAREVCFRYDNGADGCWYVVFGSAFRDLSIGQHLESEAMGGDFCAPHPTPSPEAADRDCPAFTALDKNRVIPNP